MNSFFHSFYWLKLIKIRYIFKKSGKKIPEIKIFYNKYFGKKFPKYNLIFLNFSLTFPNIFYFYLIFIDFLNKILFKFNWGCDVTDWMGGTDLICKQPSFCSSLLCRQFCAGPESIPLPTLWPLDWSRAAEWNWRPTSSLRGNLSDPKSWKWSLWVAY